MYIYIYIELTMARDIDCYTVGAVPNLQVLHLHPETLNPKNVSSISWLLSRLLGSRI